MELNLEDIERLCDRVAHFSGKAGLRFKAMPVIEWEFASIDEYMRARAMLMSVLTPDLVNASAARTPRPASSHVEEIEIFNVTFRLICRQMLATPYGTVGAARVSSVISISRPPK